eukprot:g73408.t1
MFWGVQTLHKCQFAFRPHTWKKDSCYFCGRPEDKHSKPEDAPPEFQDALPNPRDNIMVKLPYKPLPPTKPCSNGFKMVTKLAPLPRPLGTQQQVQEKENVTPTKNVAADLEFYDKDIEFLRADPFNEGFQENMQALKELVEKQQISGPSAEQPSENEIERIRQLETLLLAREEEERALEAQQKEEHTSRKTKTPEQQVLELEQLLHASRASEKQLRQEMRRQLEQREDEMREMERKLQASKQKLVEANFRQEQHHRELAEQSSRFAEREKGLKTEIQTLQAELNQTQASLQDILNAVEKRNGQKAAASKSGHKDASRKLFCRKSVHAAVNPMTKRSH